VSVRELAYVKDVGWSGYVPFASSLAGNPPMSVGGSIDLHITETGLALSPAVRTAFVLNRPVEPSIAFANVRNIRIRKENFKNRYVLTVSCYKGGRHWWNRAGIGKVALAESQFIQVAGALKSIPALKGKLNVWTAV